jgi:hypothetical protein
MRWLIQHSDASHIFGDDLPRFASKVEQGAYMNKLRDALVEAWDASLLKQFFDYSDNRDARAPDPDAPLEHAGVGRRR